MSIGASFDEMALEVTSISSCENSVRPYPLRLNILPRSLIFRLRCKNWSIEVCIPEFKKRSLHNSCLVLIEKTCYTFISVMFTNLISHNTRSRTSSFVGRSGTSVEVFVHCKHLARCDMSNGKQSLSGVRGEIRDA